MDRGGIYFGENAISHNLIMCNKANLLNQSSFRLGVPGSGKSFSVKEEIVFLILNTDDDILIADPEGEYASLIEAMDGLGAVIGWPLVGKTGSTPCIWWTATAKQPHCGEVAVYHVPGGADRPQRCGGQAEVHH